MAKTFVQLIALALILGIFITITIIPSKESMLGIFIFALPFLGGGMIYVARKNFFQNKELAAIGAISIILGITYWMDSIIVGGFNVKNAGLAVAIAGELMLLFEVLLLWESK